MGWPRSSAAALLVAAGAVGCGSFSGDSTPEVPDAAGVTDGGADAPDAPDARAPGAPQVIVTGEKHPHAVAMDATSIYWQTDGEVDTIGHINGEIAVVERAGGPRKTVVTGIVEGFGLAVQGDTLFWLQSEDNHSGGTVGRCEKNGKGRLALNRTQYTYRAVAVDAINLFVVGTFGELLRSPREGGGWIEQEKLDDTATTILLDSDSVYRGTSAEIRRVAKDQVATAPFAATPDGVKSMVVDRTSVYWLASINGKVLKLDRDKPGETPIVLATAQKNPAAIAVGGGNVYWVNRGDGTVMRVPTGGGEATVVAANQKDPIGIAADETAVVWTNAGEGTVVMAKIP